MKNFEQSLSVIVAIQILIVAFLVIRAYFIVYFQE